MTLSELAQWAQVGSTLVAATALLVLAAQVRHAILMSKVNSYIATRNQLLDLNALIVAHPDVGKPFGEDPPKAFSDSVFAHFEMICVLRHNGQLDDDAWEAELRFMRSVWKRPEIRATYEPRLPLYNHSLRQTLRSLDAPPTAPLQTD